MAQALNDKQLIFSGTTAHIGRKTSVFPGNSELRHLHYGRILLDSSVPHVRFDTEARETALLAMHGSCTVKVDGKEHTINQYDAIYVPRGRAVEVTTSSHVDLVECAAEVDGDYPLQVVPYEQVKQNPAQKFTAGGLSTSRDLNIVIGDNVNAGRILMGFTKSQPGNWTSWPPHEHTELLEEVYVYFDMPAPAFGIQLVYTDPQTPEFVSIVRDGDAVLMPAGYHPNVAAPGHGINFIWMMAAHREVEDRKFGVVNVQPGFDQKGSGLEASHGGAQASAAR
ncbi:MAG TPA: 5-deoxy-glucuronate isomerase [Polyangiaceae bacterium]|nr:5-deoxy-glucuronate isomerase [Polyangiaceae bacterium]